MEEESRTEAGEVNKAAKPRPFLRGELPLCGDQSQPAVYYS